MVTTDKKIIAQILTRSVADIIVRQELIKKLTSGQQLVCKLGIDPTGPLLHIGHMIPIRKLREFQKLGHHVVLIVGDYTARIGDPTGRDKMREPLTKDQIQKNLETYQKQISLILDLNETKFRYQTEWYDDFGLEKIMELAGLFSVQQMLERDMFQKRIKNEQPIGIHEFLYPLLQGYDSVAIQADIEFGGTDQTFNLLAGRTIQTHFKQRPQNILTTELLEGTDGRKMSKTFGNFIAVQDTPSDMFGKVMSLADELIVRYFLLATDVTMEEIHDMEKKMREGANPRNMKARLAQEIVTLYHGAVAAEKAAQEFDRIFKNHSHPTNMPGITLTKTKLTWPEILLETKLAPSKTEARRLIAQNAVKLNGQKLAATEKPVSLKNNDIIQVGKRKFIKIILP